MVKGLVHSVHERKRIQTAVLLYPYHFLFLIVCGIQIWQGEAWEIWSRVCVRDGSWTESRQMWMVPDEGAKAVSCICTL